MRRREFINAIAAAGAGAGLARGGRAAGESRSIIMLDWFRCRRDLDVQRLRDFFGASMVPAYNRAGLKPVGIFQTSVGPDSPSFLVVTLAGGFAALQDVFDKLHGDTKFNQEAAAFDEKWELAYDRMESHLLFSFKTMKGIEIPPVAGGKANLFELRTYESRSYTAHTKKVSMFDTGEIDVFRRTGIRPVFFGSAVFGTNLPNLTYMVSFPSLEARAEAWGKFGQDPDWKKMSSAPGMGDRELVTRISNQLMSPLPSSQIR